MAIRYTEVFTELVRAQIELWNDLDSFLESTVGVNLAQYQALAAIRAISGPSRVQDISQEMLITVGAASKVVDRLERDGFAVRSANPSDRRSSIVSLSDEGLRALSAADEAAEAHLEQAIGGALPGDAAWQLFGQMTALRAHFRQRVTQ
ncbi:MAG: putative MarR family transcriptional regulator [Glaciihabitans sp.]|nr:putative MarR family transcriptional regulator [Glaciihabitans sp.]